VGAVGDWVKISGSEWVPNEMVTVTFDGTQFLVMSDPSGALNSAIQVPPPSVHGPTVVTAQDNYGNFAAQTFLKEDFVVYEYGHWAIHYTTDSQDKDCVLDLRDLHDTNGNLIPNGIPDCVDMMAKEAELCWQAEIDQFGYMPPASASWCNKYHAYIRDMEFCSVSDGPGTDPGDTHIRMPGDLTDEILVDAYYANLRLNDLKVCIGHELYHGIQSKYYAMVPQAARLCLPGWITEGSATWMGKEVTGFYSPPVVPYVSPDYLAQTYKGLDPADCNGYFLYEGCLFFYFLADNNQINFTGTGTKRDIIRRYWEEVSAHGDLDNKQNFDHALSSAPGDYNSFNEAFMAFAKANYFRNSWYPQWGTIAEVTTHTVDLKTATLVVEDTSMPGVFPVDNYGAEYFVIQALDDNYVHISLQANDPQANFFLRVYPEGNENEEQAVILSNGKGEINVKANNTVVIVGRLDDSSSSGAFQITTIPMSTPTLTQLPAISISPPAGSVGTSVTVTGISFGASTSVSISINGFKALRLDVVPESSSLGSATTNSSGSFSKSATIPSLSAGSKTVSATDGSRTATCTFEVTGTVTPTPTPVPTPTSTGTTVQSQTASISSHLVRVWGYSGGTWYMYDPADAVGSDLSTLTSGKGYWINVNADCTLVYGGYSYALSTGWNLIG
jgi:hypothetical protein